MDALPTQIVSILDRVDVIVGLISTILAYLLGRLKSRRRKP